ncbi:MAG: outer membrane beta-barrel protein [Planctomycetota bacterium]|nr:outer membrane beta-barrel protein [Planctomycetota bacterium]
MAELTTDESGRLKPPMEGAAQGKTTNYVIESPQIPYIPPLQTRAPRQQAFGEEPDGIRMGRWTLHPMMTERLTYDDNVNGADETRQIHDFISEHAPGIGVNYMRGRNFKARGSYTFGWHDYLDDTQRDYLTHDATVEAEWSNAGVRGLTILVRQSYNQTGNTQVLEDEFLSFTRVQGYSSAINLGYVRGRISVATGYELAFTDYFGRTATLNDYHAHSIPIVFSYKLSQRLVPYLTYNYTANRFQHRDGIDFDTHIIKGGIRATLTRKFSVDVSAGNSRAIAIEPYDSNDGQTYNFNLEYRHSSRIMARLSASHGFSAGVRTGSATNTEFEIGGDFKLTRQFNISTSGMWRTEDRDSGLQQSTLTAQVGFFYHIKKFLQANAVYNRSERSSNAGPDIAINQVQFGFNFRW